MKRILTLLFTIVIFIMGSYWSADSNVGSIMFFYNPETNINNFATLKTEFEKYLATQGAYQFQPFNEKNTFEQVISHEKGNVYLLSNWHLKELQKKNIKLKIALVGSSKGNITQSKILSAKIETTDISMLQHSTIASSGTENYTRSLLKQMLGANQQNLIDNINILTVPKDIDALMAVGFGMANAAISAESSLDKLAKINPNQFQQLHTLGKSKASYLLVAATLEAPNQAEQQLLEILKKMSKDESGEKNLRLLGLDEWKSL